MRSVAPGKICHSTFPEINSEQIWYKIITSTSKPVYIVAAFQGEFCAVKLAKKLYAGSNLCQTKLEVTMIGESD